ncbi:MAG: hypothetical protein H6973_20100 [Gammaproteobacteria bacterium]|nr:hypothetical protein [Gammaproteobacteria bacterium]HRX71624.1 hypothetical protein [Candidatus Competibacteraceae bacterium]
MTNPTVKFWISAFIPKTVKGYTQVIPKGVHAGKTAVPLPGVARTWPGNWGKDWDAGYLTDQRGFSSLQSASHRMQSSAVVDLVTKRLIHSAHTTSGTTEVNLVTGKQTGFKNADMSRCSLEQKAPVFRGPPPFGGVGAHLRATQGGTTFPGQIRPDPPATGPAVLSLVAKAGDPLVGMAADIDFVGIFTVSPTGANGKFSVSFEGKIDDFPAYECYVTFNGVTKKLFTNSPPPGNTVVDLLGFAKRPVSGSMSFP